MKKSYNNIDLIHGHLYFYIFDGEPFISFYIEEGIGVEMEKSFIEVWWNSNNIYDPSSVNIDLAEDHIILLKDLGDNGFEEDFIPMLKKEFPEYFI